MSTHAPVNSETQNGPRPRTGAETRARLLDARLQQYADQPAKSIRQLQLRARVGVDQLTRLFINARQPSD